MHAPVTQTKAKSKTVRRFLGFLFFLQFFSRDGIVKNEPVSMDLTLHPDDIPRTNGTLRTVRRRANINKRRSRHVKRTSAATSFPFRNLLFQVFDFSD